MKKAKFIIFLFASLCFTISNSYAQISYDHSFNSTGIVFTNFNSGADLLRAIKIQPDGKIIAAGGVIALSGTDWDYGVARYNTNGSLDTTFNHDGKTTIDLLGNFDKAYALEIQPDGKILVGGTSLNSCYITVLLRLNANGSLDTNFGINGKAEVPGCSTSYDMALLPDGKIMMGGTGSGNLILARFNSNGNIDSTFATYGVSYEASGLFTNPATYGLTVSPDGKIAVIATSNMPPFNYIGIVRYNANGSLDTSFNSPDGYTTIVGSSSETYSGLDVLAQADGKLIITGSYYYASGWTAINSILTARYNVDGSLDPSFGVDGIAFKNFSSGCGGRYLLMQPDGKIMVAGGVGSSFVLLRYLSNGQLDHTFGYNGMFTTNFGSSSGLGGIALQNDGKILLAGYEMDFVIARLINGPIINDPLPADLALGVYPNPTDGLVTISLSDSCYQADLKITNSVGQVIIHQANLNGTNFSIDISHFKKGFYYLAIEEDTRVTAVKLIKL